MFHATNFHELSKYLAGRRTAITIGVFDGLHLGHHALIRRTIESAQKHDLVSVVITFPEHPLALLAPPFQPCRLMSRTRRAQLLDCMGTDVLVEVPFDTQFAATEAETFVTKHLVEDFGVGHLICGYDFTFGKGGRGNIELLESLASEHGFTLHVIDPVRDQDINVKSTHIRDLLFGGKVEDAARLLGRPFEMMGTVVTGRRQGRTIGFPTANLAVESNYLVPGIGVYAAAASVPDGKSGLPAMVNIGNSPTFGDNALTVEVHLIDWSGDLEGKTLTIHLLRRVRNEVKFPSVDALVEQLRRDKVLALEAFRQSTMLPVMADCPPV